MHVPQCHCSTIHSSQDVEATQMSINRWVHKEVAVCVCVCIYIHTHTMEYYSAIKRNEFESVLLRWMNLESVIQISYINTYIWKLEEWYWWPYLQVSSRDADIENRLVDTVGEGEAGRNQERKFETYTLPHILEMDSQWEFAYNTGSSAWHSVET